MALSAAQQINQWLHGSPYLVAEDAAGNAWAETVLDQQVKIANDVRAAQSVFSEQGEALKSALLQDFDERLVFESNAIEGVTASLRQTRDFLEIERSQDYIAEYSFKEGLSADKKMLEVMGHGGALRFVRDLATQLGSERLREVDIRNIHKLTMVSEPRIAGHYKTMDNEIAGRRFSTAKSDDIGLRVRELTEWLANTQLQGPLVAAVVQAWLADLHPFDDGNGRVSRLLANYVLFKNAWPCLIIRSDADRQRYYEALEESDNGDIGPLFSLFVDSLSRTVADMCHPEFAQALLLGDLQRAKDFDLFQSLLVRFTAALAEALGQKNRSIRVVGSLSERDYAWLQQDNAAGNGWWAKVGREHGVSTLLLWFGYSSRELREAAKGNISGGPSIYVSIRDESPNALHPYRPLWSEPGLAVHEVHFVPQATDERIFLRANGDVVSKSVPAAAALFADALVDIC